MVIIEIKAPQEDLEIIIKDGVLEKEDFDEETVQDLINSLNRFFDSIERENVKIL